ncbi:hypothetical protein [Halothiobacillus sp.]|uniref:hypothetical protein n=1 Tax=Halothiobacillus sp. TaxID=1891311 RepID=UPI002AD443D8|nr:hypothetical protein [Halothiobacillus sp.]
MLSFLKKSHTVESTPFSDFIRNASSEQKKRVYAGVLKEATERQQKVIKEAALRKVQAQADQNKTPLGVI